jgi:hypothetical protein
MEDVRLNWAEAHVEDAKLTVSLEGEMPSGWKKSFENTVRLLGSGGWDKIEVKKQTVRVANVSPGDEDKLRHYLEGVVEQANAAHRADEDRAAQSGDDRETSREGPDAEMTERFRGFADEPADAEKQGGGS